MKITIDIPDGLSESLTKKLGRDLTDAAKEDLAVAWYQAELISIGLMAEFLGTSVYEAEGLLKRRHVESHYSIEDFERDRAALASLLPPANTCNGPSPAKAPK